MPAASPAIATSRPSDTLTVGIGARAPALTASQMESLLKPFSEPASSAARAPSAFVESAMTAFRASTTCTQTAASKQRPTLSDVMPSTASSEKVCWPVGRKPANACVTEESVTRPGGRISSAPLLNEMPTKPWRTVMILSAPCAMHSCVATTERSKEKDGESMHIGFMSAAGSSTTGWPGRAVALAASKAATVASSPSESLNRITRASPASWTETGGRAPGPAA